MNFKYYLLIFLIPCSLIGQINQVDYRVFIEGSHFENSSELSGKLGDDVLKNTINNLRDLSFSLYYNDSISYYEKNKELKNEGKEGINIVKILGGNNYYTDLSSHHSLQITRLAPKQLVKKDSIKWTIVPNETKQILNTKTIKARGALVYSGSRGDKRLRNIEAWFAPSIPTSVGPDRFCGLPGLILSIKLDNGLQIEAQRFTKNSKKQSIKIPEHTIITEEELTNRLKKIRESMRN